ncbi:MAG: bifunctional DNA primase/polymerase [Nitrospina sp.]|nr:bifunctional DNA primase/polymerase [Nitrospina sp.]
MPENETVNNEILEAALDYAEHGISVIPILPGEKKDPPIKWKEFQSRIASPDEIKRWWKKWPKANVAIVTGGISGIDCIDGDGPFALDNLEGQSGVKLPETVSQSTGRKSGGKHLIYQYHGDRTLKNWKGFADNGNGSKCDLRTNGGYFVAAPSVHESGKK